MPIAGRATIASSDSNAGTKLVRPEDFAVRAQAMRLLVQKAVRRDGPHNRPVDPPRDDGGFRIAASKPPTT
jgi:hypothetical protein